MLAIEIDNKWVPISGYTDFFIDKSEEGEESLSFDIHKDNSFYQYMRSLVRLKSDDNIYSIIGANKPAEVATITAELDMSEWKTEHFTKCAEISALQTKTIVDVLEYIKPIGWDIVGGEFSVIKRTPDCEKCNRYDILMRCKTIYDVQYDIDTISKTITIVDPYASHDDGVYITPELNMTGLDYKETGTGIVTRLYCYGADDMTFSSVNGGKPYVENYTYTDKVITGQWVDGRYYDMSKFLVDAQKKVNELAVPVGCYTISTKDLAAYDDKYKDLKFKLRHNVHCIIDPKNNIDIIHKIVNIRRYPDNESETIVTLSNAARTIESEIKSYQENVTELTQDGYKKETTIRNNSESIELIAKGLGEAQLKLQEDQIVALISKAINNGNSMQTMQVIIDILGLTIKNGGIKVYDGNNSLVLYVDQNSKKLVMNGSIESQSGHIGGWSLDSEGLTASYTANIPNYTSADTEKIKQFILGQITLTDAEYDYLDIDRSGTITSADYVIMKNVISGLHSHTWRYDYVISPYDPAKFVKVHIDMGNGTSRDRYISLMGISTDAMRYVNDKVRG